MVGAGPFIWIYTVKYENLSLQVIGLHSVERPCGSIDILCAPFIHVQIDFQTLSLMKSKNHKYIW